MKQRLDILLVERGLCVSREQAQGHILAGNVYTHEQRLDKAGMKYPLDIPLEIRGEGSKYASRAGDKLEQAIAEFKVVVGDRVALDVGASTGGFTDCLLQHGARHVFAVDVGHGQIDSKLRTDSRVSVLEKCNARYLTPESLRAERSNQTPLPEEISLVVVDVSFISLAKIVEPVFKAFANISQWVFLFKPQFEVGPENLRKGGVVKDEATALAALENFKQFADKLGLRLHGAVPTKLAGKKSGNLEYLLHYERILH